jgi:predicted outer membrane protein
MIDEEFVAQEARLEARDRLGKVIIKAFDKTYRDHEIDYDPDTCYEAAELVIDYYDTWPSKLLEACRKLFDAPHQENFVTRLNDPEMDALNLIKKIVEGVVDGDQISKPNL